MIHYIKCFTGLFVSVAVFTLSGCGQKGDLYLPAIPPAPSVVEANIVEANSETKQTEIDPSDKSNVENEKITE